MGEKSVQKVGGKSVQARYGKAPIEVLEDLTIGSPAKVIHCWLAMHVFQGSTCSIGMRRIGVKLGYDKSTVSKAMQQLERAGHIAISGSGKERRIYHLNSTVFGTKQGTSDVIVSSPRGNRLVSVDNEKHGLPPREGMS